MSFASLGLCPELLAALAEQPQFNRPYPIQSQVIPAILRGRDLLAISKTGSGKTAGFTLPILQLIRQTSVERRSLKALILVPTRELAAQVKEVARHLGRHLTPRVKSCAVFGGVAINPQMIRLRGVELLVATPGRLLELVSARSVQLSTVATLVLDEADRLLSEDFQEELKQILAMLPKKRQNLLFAATFREDVERLAESLLADPLRVEIKSEEKSEAELIAQQIYTVDPSRKGPLLRFLIKSGDWKQVLVFTSSQKRADTVTKKLLDNGISAATFHSGMSQGGRTAALAAFKAGTLRVLVATDLAARGIDIMFLPHVVNYELPRSPNDYIHRIGRTGRAETSGVAVTLLCPEDLPHFRVIEKRLRQRLAKFDSTDFDLSGC